MQSLLVIVLVSGLLLASGVCYGAGRHVTKCHCGTNHAAGCEACQGSTHAAGGAAGWTYHARRHHWMGGHPVLYARPWQYRLLFDYPWHEPVVPHGAPTHPYPHDVPRAMPLPPSVDLTPRVDSLSPSIEHEGLGTSGVRFAPKSEQ
jgi:hypothetical protein